MTQQDGKKRVDEIMNNLTHDLLEEFGRFHGGGYVLAYYYKKRDGVYKKKLQLFKTLEELFEFMNNYEMELSDTDKGLKVAFEYATKTSFERFYEDKDRLIKFLKRRPKYGLAVIGAVFEPSKVLRINKDAHISASKFTCMITEELQDKEMERSTAMFIRPYLEKLEAKLAEEVKELEKQQEDYESKKQEDKKRKEATRKRQEENRIRNLNKTKKARKTKKNVYC